MAAEPADNYKLEGVKIFFSAPNPHRPGSETLTKDKEPSKEANFQWVTYQILFSKDVGRDQPDYYIYSVGLSPEGKERLPNKVFQSDSNWSGKNKDTPARGVSPGDAKRSFPEVLRGPNLNPAKIVQTVYVNTDESDKGKDYSSEEFKKLFDNNFYIVVDLHSKELKNPFGKMVGMQYPEKTPEETAVKAAMEKMAQEELDAAETGGFDIIQKQYYKHHQQPPQPAEPSGFNVMQQQVEKPEPVKKV